MVKIMFITVILAICYAHTAVATGTQCSFASRPDSFVSSDADFWRGYEGAEHITELDDDSHQGFINDNPKAFIIYYATWCGQAKQSREGFAKAAKNQDGKVSFGAVDCEKVSEACKSDSRINGYPTFLFYRDQAAEDEYTGRRNALSFISYLNRK